MITGLARLDGWPVAVLSEDPYIYGGGWTANGSEKATRLIDLANTFHLPIVHLSDVPGFYIGSQSEQGRLGEASGENSGDMSRHGRYPLSATGMWRTLSSDAR